MKQIRKLNIIFLLVFSGFSILKSQDSIPIPELTNDTLKQQLVLTSDTSLSSSVQFNYTERSFPNKLGRGFAYSAFLNATLGSLLLILPEDISKWDVSERFKITSLKKHYITSFTKPPVIDNDYWYINYIGHPYQGAFYFNTIRSQGATFWQSTLFNFGQSMLWEYLWEGGLESPSIQDIIVTPIVGSFFGELTHRATLNMRKNGFNWYEKVAVCIINPAYAINNGFR